MHQQLSSNRNSIEVLLDTNLVRASAVDNAGAELLRARLVMLAAQTALMEGKSIDNLASMQRLDGYLKKSADLIDSVRKMPETSPVGKPLFEAALAAYDVYQRDAITPMVAAIRAGKAQEAGKLNLEKVTPLGLVFTVAIQKYVDFADEVGQRVAREASARINGALAFLVAALAVVAALVVGVYAVFARAVFRPLHEAGRLFDSIAGGDLTNRVEQRANNEIGILYAAVKRMQDSLARTVSAVRHGVEEIHTGAREIAAGNIDLSSRTEQQAASLEKPPPAWTNCRPPCATTPTARATPRSWPWPSDDVAARRRAVGVGTMRAIADSSSRIADIVGVIEGIAFQTNILALNAAVGGSRRRAGQGLRGGGQRSARAGPAQRPGGQGNQGLDRRLGAEGLDRLGPGGGRRRHHAGNRRLGAARHQHHQRNLQRVRGAVARHPAGQPGRLADGQRDPAERRAGRAGRRLGRVAGNAIAAPARSGGGVRCRPAA